MAADQRLTEVVGFVDEFLEADTAVLRAALGEPDDDKYLAIVRRATDLYSSSEGLPLGPKAGRFAVPGRRSHLATTDPGSRAGRVAFALARIAEPDGWLAFVSGAYDMVGASLGAVLLIENVGNEMKVAGRATRDPFVDGVAWAESGGKSFSVDGPFEEAEILRIPLNPEHAQWLSERLGT